MDYFLMSKDVLNLMDEMGHEKVSLLGHSMGGKVFMCTALTHDSHVRQFLATNMIHKDGRFRWRVNLDSIINNYLPLCKFPEFDTQYKGPTLFIGGSESEYIT
ncbi:hypothetical protein KUTeg_010412 [Tegillarca granosa]|uniref:sn-1-specific diacylglycerol lipase ABHD11 n=1 Tax=Tegillarca granosa TaxID=220873 RepID=A0ABQ9F6M7_TEGGR|nr:hypothetical protein KUTeg_010412 [Tegillarca granosa]